MLKIYVMPDGNTRQFEDALAPKGAKLAVTENKSVKAPANKAVEKGGAKK